MNVPFKHFCHDFGSYNNLYDAFAVKKKNNDKDEDEPEIIADLVYEYNANFDMPTLKLEC